MSVDVPRSATAIDVIKIAIAIKVNETWSIVLAPRRVIKSIDEGGGLRVASIAIHRRKAAIRIAPPGHDTLAIAKAHYQVSITVTVQIAETQ